MHHRSLIRIFRRNLIDNIEGKIEFFFVMVSDIRRRAVFVHRGFDEFAAYELLRPVGGYDAVADFTFRLCLTRQNDSAEAAVLSVHGDHAVGCGGIIKDAVSLVQNLRIGADLHL